MRPWMRGGSVVCACGVCVVCVCVCGVRCVCARAWRLPRGGCGGRGGRGGACGRGPSGGLGRPRARRWPGAVLTTHWAHGGAAAHCAPQGWRGEDCIAGNSMEQVSGCGAGARVRVLGKGGVRED